MTHGLFLDPRAWSIDFLPSPSWHPEKYGLKIDLHDGAFNIPKTGIPDKYKFVITCEVWEIPMRKTLKYLRERGIKIFLVPREAFKTDVLKETMFAYNKFLWEGEYWFRPDLLLASGKAYADMWGGASKFEITGYPRFDWWQNKGQDIRAIKTKYNIEQDKKIIFFPSFPPLFYTREANEDVLIDIYDEQEETLAALESFVQANRNYQAIVKVHPASWKAYIKNQQGMKRAVVGKMKQYLDYPTKNMKVIGDERNSGLIAKELLLASDMVIGFTTTMILEAGIVNKPSMHLLFGKTSTFKGLPSYYDHLPTAHNAAELSQMILSNTTGIVPMDFIEHYLYKQDGNAGGRICEAISNEFKRF